jgi:RNA polymerase sigma-70 factor (ECF subfamily)
MYGIMEPAAVFRANPVPWALSRARWQVLQSGPPELPSAPRSISREAFDQIVREHEGALERALSAQLRNAEDVLDCLQETFLKAYLSYDSFRGECSLRTWLLRIAVNTARSHRTRERAKKRGGAGRVGVSPHPRGLQQDTGGEPLAPEEIASPCRLLERRELKDALEDAIFELEDGARGLIVLRDLGGATYEDLQHAFDLPLGTIKSRVHRARLALRGRLAQHA